MPRPRGPLTAYVIDALSKPVRTLGQAPTLEDDALGGDDFHLALYLCYELHYSSIDAVDPDWEWEPSLLYFRRELEDAFEKELVAAVPDREPGDLVDMLVSMAEGDGALARRLLLEPSLDRFQEFVIHRSAYQLKEADPHSWAIPRLGGRAKAALVEIQTDEYGSGDPAAMHSVLFRNTMAAIGLDAGYGAYLDRLPGETLAGVNLMSMFGLHRRRRGALVGHLALFEMSSTEPNRRYGRALRRLGFGPEATRFFDEHVMADAVHETIAAHDLAGALAAEEPEIAGDIGFGARCLSLLEERWSGHVLRAWDEGRSSLLE
ncbi:MAG: iron-containing redox enzyme family protein [Actinomycetota bacterium]